MASLERDGATISYAVTGSGPPLLLGHSLLCDSTMWAGVAPVLANTRTVINIDFRGHGASVTPGPYDFDDLVGDWLAVMDREGIERAVLCGLSMGGMTAMRLAMRAPDRVAALILIDSNAARETWFRRFKYGILARIFAKKGMTAGLRAKVAPIMFGTTTAAERPELIEAFAETINRFDREQIAHAIRAVNGRDPIGDISVIEAPTLVMVGAEDQATPPFRSEFIHQHIRGSTLVTIPEAGHLSALEQPAFVTEHILAFLSEQ
jgi:pimeloyl-ACP methyl ester carboxylesterase